MKIQLIIMRLAMEIKSLQKKPKKLT